MNHHFPRTAIQAGVTFCYTVMTAES